MKTRLIKSNGIVRTSGIVRSTLAAFALFLGFGVHAWAATVLHEDFEDDSLGALKATWTVTSAGRGKVSIISTTDHGHALQLKGGTTEGEFLIASQAISSSSTEITTEADIKPSSGAAFVWTLNGAGSSIGRRRIRLQQAPGSTMLVASTVPSGNTNCGTLPPNVWTNVSLIIDTASGVFDVLFNGAPTACAGLAADIKPPFNSVSAMDASNLGWGGSVLFDNIDVSTP